jgi:hypothetical protein
MSVIYKFRISFEDFDEVIRDIEIRSTQTFEDLHQTIQACIGFDGTKPASFFISNDNWVKGQEISIDKRVSKDGNVSALMRDSKLCNYIADPHQKIYYVSDYEANWTFHIELVKILPNVEIIKNYPVCVKSINDPPKQYNTISKPVVVDEEFEAIFEEETLSPEDDSLADDDGIDIDEIQGMSEEGEEGEGEEKNEEEMEAGSESEDSQKEDDY